MSRFSRKRRPSFVTLPRHKRRHEVICLKNRIRRDASDYGGRFTSSLVLNEPEHQEDLYNQWFDFYFPGTDRFTIWNAGIVTARKAFWEKVSDIAYTRTSEMLTPEEQEKSVYWSFEPAQYSNTGKILSYRLATYEEIRFEQFGGLTFNEQWKKLEAEIISNDPPVIHESFQLDRSYVYGIGLKIILDVDAINQSSIEMAIDRFFAVGETNWVSDKPVSCDRLPTKSEDDALMAIKISKK